MKKILVTLTKKEQGIAERVIAEFSAGKALRVVSAYSAMSLDRTSLLREIADTDGYLFGLESLDEELFGAARRLKVVCKHGVGVDNVDRAAARGTGSRSPTAPARTATRWRSWSSAS